MSGGGSSGHYYDSGGGSTQIPCANLIERTYVNSPVPGIVAALKAGDVLEVQLQVGTQPAALLAVAASGSTAGTLTPPRLPQIIDCMQQGYLYIALVLEVNGGQVKVEIRPK